jgi:hypothetical protein
MDTREWTFTDDREKNGLPVEGPWASEPDKRQWMTRAGLPGLIVRNGVGALCGYVGVPRSHPWHGLDYSSADVSVDCHGGLTFSDACRGGEHGICHVVSSDEDDDVWWFGFDCAHLHDLCPGMTRYRSVHLPHDDVYRDFSYVTEEVEQLAAQLSAVTKK